MRKSGILLPVFSLPSPHGIGTLGKAAFDFVDFLSAAGQSLWQILPVGPTTFGDSPYQSYSAMAGNPYLIDLDLLAANHLLTQEEIGGGWEDGSAYINYELLAEKRLPVLEKAAARMNKTSPGYLKFCGENAWWLDDYALFMAIKEGNGGVGYFDWPAPLRTRQPEAMKKAEAQWGVRAEFWRCVQYFFYRQWEPLKTYANAQGIEIVGDIPIYVAADSSDVWANPDLFQTDENGRPTQVAGVPPDAFSATGQLWGNPLYNWPAHKKTGYAWWLRRLEHAGRLYDITRIDHFRGFAGYWSVPAGDATAERGRWCKGPGKSFLKAVHKALPGAPIIAEDLGYLTAEVRELLAYSGYPGMKVLQFAFDSREESDYLPHNYARNCVVYTGTHDNPTTKEWQHTALRADVQFARSYLGTPPRHSIVPAMVRAAQRSVAETAIIPIQDWLELGAEARVNTPSTLGGLNWRWRIKKDVLSAALAAKIREQTRIFGRLSQREREKAWPVELILQHSAIYESVLPSEIRKAVEKEQAMHPEVLSGEDEPGETQTEGGKDAPPDNDPKQDS